MYAFLTASQNIVFAVVLVLLVAFFVIELCSLLFGASLSGLLGDLDLPDLDLPEVGLNVDLDVGIATKFLYWLKIGRVPLLILIVIFMTAFVLSGYFLQFLCLKVANWMLPAWLATIAALALSVPVVRLIGRHLARIIPKDETAAISQTELVGSRAFIVIGTARKGSPAQARTSDRFGTTHYLMLEPDNPEETLERGQELLLVRHDGSRFFAIPHPDPGAE